MERTALLVADRYELQDPVGRGGMAVVHRGWDRRLDRPVALKLFRTEASTPAESARRRSETQLLASLHHPSLVTLFDAVATDEATVLVMELVEGPTLRQWLQRSPLQPEVAATMAATLAEGLHFIHERGVVHRDVKPANVLLAPSAIPGRPPVAKLSDFGIARLVEDVRVTSTGTFVGTAQYLSPEQARGEPVGPPSDVYSLGLTLLEGLTATTAFPGGPIESATARLARDPAVPGSLGYGWKSLLTAMTRRNPADRPTALEVVLATQSLLSGELDVEPPPTQTARVSAGAGRSAHRSTAAAAPWQPAAPIAGGFDEATRAFDAAAAPLDVEAGFTGVLLPPGPDAPTSVLPVAPGRRAAEALRRSWAVPIPSGIVDAVRRRVPTEAIERVVGWVRLHPLLALVLAAVAAILLAAVLIVALMPGAPTSSAVPGLPATGEPLHDHLQRLLESVSR